MSSDQEASRIAQDVVDKRLAACVSILPRVKSVYRWNEQVEIAEELLLVMKTGLSLFPQLQSAIEQAHSYDVPEVIAVPIADGSEKYLGWLGDQLERI